MNSFKPNIVFKRYGNVKWGIKNSWILPNDALLLLSIQLKTIRLTKYFWVYIIVSVVKLTGREFFIDRATTPSYYRSKLLQRSQTQNKLSRNPFNKSDSMKPDEVGDNKEITVKQPRRQLLKTKPKLYPPTLKFYM